MQACAETLSRGEQSLFYMNRRGYAPLTLCRVCGHRMKSPETESWLVEHRYSGRLVCHLTGFSMPKPKACPECLTPDSFVSIGPGVERVHEEVSNLFPTARIEIFSSDTTPSGEAVRDLVTRMENNEIDILIGTQIVAKGHNFPKLTFVGVVDADAALNNNTDLRASERTFQLISQVAGRAGRHEKKGRALIQTYLPDEPVMQSLARQDRDVFLSLLAEERKQFGMPPYGRLAAVIVSATSDQLANEAARTLGRACAQRAGARSLGTGAGAARHHSRHAPPALLDPRRSRRRSERLPGVVDGAGETALGGARADRRRSL